MSSKCASSARSGDMLYEGNRFLPVIEEYNMHPKDHMSMLGVRGAVGRILSGARRGSGVSG